MTDKILERVRKLLALSESDNVNEAASAAKQAQALMSRHTISEAMLDVSADADEKAEAIEVDTLHQHPSTQLPSWKGQLAMAMSEVNQCECYRSGSGGLGIIGRPSDASTVRYLFSYVAREIDRITDMEAAQRGQPGRTWLNNFRMGAVQEVNRRMREAFKETRAAMKQEADTGDSMGTGTALVLVNSALVKLDQRHEDAVKYGKEKLKLRSTSGSRTRYNAGARQAGTRAGASINIGGSKGIGTGSKKALRS